MGDNVGELAKAAAYAAAVPADLGGWLRLGFALHEVGEAALAASCFSALGRAASELGAVALAVACARWLQNGSPEASAELVQIIARTHCKGSARIDSGSIARPPVPPPTEVQEPQVPQSRQQAIELASRAVEAARSAAEERSPARLPPTKLVHVLEPAEFAELASVAELSMRKAGEVIVDVGDLAESLFWIARGTAVVTRDEHELGEVRANAFFGEIALLAGTTRTARVTCSEPTWLLSIPAASVETLASTVPRLATVLANYARSRLLSNVMRTSALFARLTESERTDLLPKFSLCHFTTGDSIIARGGDNDQLYVLASGECEVRDGSAVTATLRVGDGFGEMSLISRKPATADVVAARPTVVLALGRDAFDELAVAHPGLLAEVYKLLVSREQEILKGVVHDASDLVI